MPLSLIPPPRMSTPNARPTVAKARGEVKLGRRSQEEARVESGGASVRRPKK